MNQKKVKWYSPCYQGTGLFFWTGLLLLPALMVCSLPFIAVAVVSVGGFMVIKLVIDKCHTKEIIR
jgi:hypothetical protein